MNDLTRICENLGEIHEFSQTHLARLNIAMRQTTEAMFALNAAVNELQVTVELYQPIRQLYDRVEGMSEAMQSILTDTAGAFDIVGDLLRIIPHD